MAVTTATIEPIINRVYAKLQRSGNTDTIANEKKALVAEIVALA